MKLHLKIILFIAFSTGSIMSFAQGGLEFGPTVGLNSTWIVNPNTLITHQEIKPELTLTGEYGGQVMIRLGKRFGIGGGFSYGKLSQKYDWNEDTLSIVSLETFNIPVFIRIGNRFYSETGAQFTAYNQGTLSILENFEEDVLDTFRKNNIYLFQGLGLSIPFSNHLNLNIGGRFGYGIQDIRGVSPQGYDYESLNEIAAFVNAGGEVTDHPEYEEYQEYIGYFETAQDFAETYERLNKTHGFYFTVMGSLTFRIGKSKGSDK